MAKRIPKLTKIEQNALQGVLIGIDVDQLKLTNTQSQVMYNRFCSMPHCSRRDKQKVLDALRLIDASVFAISRKEVHDTIKNDTDCKRLMISLRYLVSGLEPGFTDVGTI